MATFVEFISSLHSCKQQAIVWHHQTTSFAEHKTLNGFYDEIVGLIDGLVESVSGIYGRPTGYDTHDLVDWTSTDDTIKYFQALYKYVQESRKDIYQDSWIQNEVDTISALIASTIYKLTLK